MKILAFRGKGFISKAIQFQTRSPYSHIAIQLRDGTFVEAWHVGGVCHIEDLSENHKPGTVVDVFGIQGSYDIETIENFLLDQVGLRYDFLAIFRFLSRRKMPANSRWFCSELCEEAFIRGGQPLLRGNPSEHAPGHTSMSPLLQACGSFTI